MMGGIRRRLNGEQEEEDFWLYGQVSGKVLSRHTQVVVRFDSSAASQTEFPIRQQTAKQLTRTLPCSIFQSCCCCQQISGKREKMCRSGSSCMEPIELGDSAKVQVEQLRSKQRGSEYGAIGSFHVLRLALRPRWVGR